MFARLHVIVSSEDDKEIQMIKRLIIRYQSNFSISPSREYAGLKIIVNFISLVILQKKKSNIT